MLPFVLIAITLGIGLAFGFLLGWVKHGLKLGAYSNAPEDLYCVKCAGTPTSPKQIECDAAFHNTARNPS